jgi:hypothetical protein
MLICLGDEGLNLAAIEDWKWIEATKELSVTFSMNRIKTYKGEAAVALRRALKGNGLLGLVADLLPVPNGARVDAAQQVLVAAPVAGVAEGTLNT